MADTDFNQNDQIRILVVDDSHSFRWVLRDIFEKIPGYRDLMRKIFAVIKDNL